MSLLKAIKAQLGLSSTATQNFTLTAEAQDGTMKLARGNAGATTQDILTVGADGKVTATQGYLGDGSGLTGISSPITTKLVTDSTDIVLNDIASSYNNVGSSFSISIPVSGEIRISPDTFRLRADGATTTTACFGIRIGTTNYWPSYTQVVSGVGPTLNYMSTLQVSASNTNDYIEADGAGISSYATVIVVKLPIQGKSIPTGTQTVQLISARSSAGACSFRGTAKPTRVTIEFVSAA